MRRGDAPRKKSSYLRSKISKTITLDVCSKARTNEIIYESVEPKSWILRASRNGRCTAGRGGAGRGRSGLRRSVRPRNNHSPCALTHRERPCRKHEQNKSFVNRWRNTTSDLPGTASALRFWLLIIGPTPICLCKPFLCKACPGIHKAAAGN